MPLPFYLNNVNLPFKKKIAQSAKKIGYIRVTNEMGGWGWYTLTPPLSPPKILSLSKLGVLESDF